MELWSGLKARIGFFDGLPEGNLEIFAREHLDEILDTMRIIFLYIFTLLVLSGYSQRVDNFFEKGNAWYELGDYKGAIKEYTKAIRIKPDQYEAYFKRGVAQEYLRNYSSAMADFTKAIEINPGYAEAYFKMGVARAFINNNEVAIENFTKAIGFKPAYFEAYFNRGIVKERVLDYLGQFWIIPAL